MSKNVRLMHLCRPATNPGEVAKDLFGIVGTGTSRMAFCTWRRVAPPGCSIWSSSAPDFVESSSRSLDVLAEVLVGSQLLLSAP